MDNSCAPLNRGQVHPGKGQLHQERLMAFYIAWETCCTCQRTSFLTYVRDAVVSYITFHFQICLYCISYKSDYCLLPLASKMATCHFRVQDTLRNKFIPVPSHLLAALCLGFRFGQGNMKQNSDWQMWNQSLFYNLTNLSKTHHFV